MIRAFLPRQSSTSIYPMLACRAFSRSISHIRHDTLKLQRAGLRTSSRAQFQTRPATISRRLWYRPDGTPRSKVTGLVVGTISFAAVYTMYSMLSLIAEFDAANYMLTCLVHIQRADVDFPSVDLTSSHSTLSHFREICAAFGDIPQHIIDDFFDDVEALSGPAKDQAHKVLRDACLAVHDILMKSKGRDTWDTATEVVGRLDEAIINLVEVVEEAAEEEAELNGGGKALRNRRIKDQIAKDPSSRSSEYEVLG